MAPTSTTRSTGVWRERVRDRLRCAQLRSRGGPWRLLPATLLVVTIVVAYLLTRWMIGQVTAPLDGCNGLLVALQTNGDLTCPAEAAPDLSAALWRDTATWAFASAVSWAVVWLGSPLPAYFPKGLRRPIERLPILAGAGIVLAVVSYPMLEVFVDSSDLSVPAFWAHVVAALTWGKWFAVVITAVGAVFVLWHIFSWVDDTPRSFPREADATGAIAGARAEQPGPIGVCLSGGGVRSAGFALGAMYELESDEKFLSRLRHLSAVSGGNYTATGWTLHRYWHEMGRSSPPGWDGPDLRVPAGRPPAASALVERLLDCDPLAGECEQIDIGRWPSSRPAGGEASVATPARPDRLLRRPGDHRFLLNGPGGLHRAVLWGVLAVVVNLVMLAAMVYVWARPLGWLLRSPALFPSIRTGCALGDGTATTGLDCVRFGGRQWWPIVGLLGVVAVLQVVAAVWSRVLPAARAAMVALGGMAAGLFIATIAGPWLLRTGSSLFATEFWAQVSFFGVSVAALLGAVLRMLQDPLARVAPRLGGAVLAVLVLLLMGYVIRSSAVSGWAGAEWLWWTSLAVFAIAAIGSVDLQTASLRELYRNRLTNSFTPRSQGHRDGTEPQSHAKFRPSNFMDRAGLGSGSDEPTPGILWTDLEVADLPELIVCCAASRVGLATTGAPAESYVISPTNVIHRTSDEPNGAQARTVATDEFVKRLDSNALLPLQGPAGWMSTSGAAFASAMGRLSVGSSGALLAAFNVDLGIWLPSLRYQHRATMLPSIALGNLVSEILGFYGPNALHTFVSDGGHYENLGLVELLHRREDAPPAERSRYTVCFDASNDKPLTFSTLREALKIADVALRQRLDFDLSALPAADSDYPTKQSVYRIPFWHYPRPETKTDPVGVILYAKLQAASDQPANVRKYFNTNTTAPHVSTSNQLLTDRHFLYLLLAGRAAAETVRAELERLEDEDAHI